MKFEILDGVMDYNISGLQPDTKYSVQVAALTRKGDGDRSNSQTVKTPGGVPIRPVVNLKVLERDPTVSIELEWERPAQTYGELRGYRVKWGVKDHNKLQEEMLGAHLNTKRIKDLERGIEYEFRIAGFNQGLFTYSTKRILFLTYIYLSFNSRDRARSSKILYNA